MNGWIPQTWHKSKYSWRWTLTDGFWRLRRPRRRRRKQYRASAKDEQAVARLFVYEEVGAGDRDRTGDIQLGKLTFCH
jgi:hypothetical protein